MMRKTIRQTALALTVGVLLAPACSRDPEPGTPAAAAEGERLMRQMSDTLVSASTFRFATAESLEHPDRSTGRVLHFTRTVTVRRPDAMFFELDGTGDTAIDVSAYYDGKTVSLRNNAHGMWAETSVPGTLDEMLDDVARRYSLPVPIADVIYSLPYEAFIGRDTKGGFVGRETIDGIECARLGYVDNLVDVQIWIPSSGQPLPRRVELVYKQVPGAAQGAHRLHELGPRAADCRRGVHLPAWGGLATSGVRAARRARCSRWRARRASPHPAVSCGDWFGVAAVMSVSEWGERR